MNNIKISVILPNYNSDKHIAKAIDSFLWQTYENKELIIVDAKSSDQSHAIIEEYSSRHSNIIWIKEKDRNVTDAINIGLKYCSGDFISFLASDVFYYADNIFSCISNHYNIVKFDCIYFDYYCHFTKQKQLKLYKCPNVEFTRTNLLKYGTLAGFDNVFLSKEVYKKHQYNPDYNLCSDWEFFLRISEEQLLFWYIEKVCTVNVQDGDNLSLKYQTEQLRQIREVGEKYNTEKVLIYLDANIQQVSISGKVKFRIKQVIKKLIRYK